MRSTKPTGRLATPRSSRVARRVSGGHALARLLAAAALLRTLLHHPVIAGHVLAVLGARAADIGADPADELVPVGSPQHEVRRGLTDLGAIEQQPDVGWIGVLASEFEAVIYGLKADVVTSQTLVAAFLHLSGDGLGGGVVRH
ncbi:MAG: hypothetical protein ACRENB_11980 [Gemmatimonadales bacterium]